MQTYQLFYVLCNVKKVNSQMVVFFSNIRGFVINDIVLTGLSGIIISQNFNLLVLVIYFLGRVPIFVSQIYCAKNI